MTNTEVEKIGTDIWCPSFSATEPGDLDLACTATASSATKLQIDSWRKAPLSPETDGRRQQQEISKSRSNDCVTNQRHHAVRSLSTKAFDGSIINVFNSRKNTDTKNTLEWTVN